ncbi:hypothetical protein B0H14DRAFT_3009395 [Mycena olivaceomarginata]|nr:hypothetical protein B0H14DRAFT_3009395 [Mycena olivaceomarginata]
MSANISALYEYPNAAELLPKAILVTSFQTDVPIYIYLFVTHCASWIFAMARIWGDAAQIEGALGLASDEAANLPGYIDCSSLFLILAAADLLLVSSILGS